MEFFLMALHVVCGLISILLDTMLNICVVLILCFTLYIIILASRYNKLLSRTGSDLFRRERWLELKFESQQVH
jgi:hypothetical protein